MALPKKKSAPVSTQSGAQPSDPLKGTAFAPFQCSKVEESDRYYLLFGETEVYKVYKHVQGDSRQTLSFAERWKLACEDLCDLSPLSPGLCLGLRTLRWIDGKIAWLQDAPMTRVRGGEAPSLADEVCLVMRRIPEHLFLDIIHEEAGRLSEIQLRTLARSVLEFQRLQQAHEKKRARFDYDIVASKLSAVVGENLAEIRTYFEEPEARLLRVLTEELDAQIKKSSNGVIEELFKRAEQGFVVDGLGSPSLGSCAATRLPGARTPFTFVARGRRSIDGRRADVISDITSLAFDLEQRGDALGGQALLHYYFEIAPEFKSDALVRFFSVQHHVQHALQLAQAGESILVVMRTLSRAFRLVIGFDSACLVMVGGPESTEKSQLVRDLSCILGASLIDSARYAELKRSGRLDEVTNSSRAAGMSLVVSSSFERRFERLQLYRSAEMARLPYHFIRCEYGRHELAALKVLSVESETELFDSRRPGERNLQWDREMMDTQFGIVLVEPSVSLPVLALTLLYNLKRLTEGWSEFDSGLEQYFAGQELVESLHDILRSIEDCELRARALDDPHKNRKFI